MLVWPAIDLRGGRCVRLRQGDYARETIFSDDPAAMARTWVEAGAERLHLVDLDGARDGVLGNLAAIGRIIAAAGVPCQVGGGIRDEARIEELLAAGAERLVVGTRALREPDWFATMCRKHPRRLVLGIDARNGRVATDGWLATSDVLAVDFAVRLQNEPLAAIVYTDISRDGMLAGPNLEAMAEMKRAARTEVIASGGVSGAADVAALARLGLDGCIIGRALYEGTISLPEAVAAARQPPAGAAAE